MFRHVIVTEKNDILKVVCQETGSIGYVQRLGDGKFKSLKEQG